jgi:hypothetical protein
VQPYRQKIVNYLVGVLDGKATSDGVKAAEILLSRRAAPPRSMGESTSLPGLAAADTLMKKVAILEQAAEEGHLSISAWREALAALADLVKVSEGDDLAEDVRLLNLTGMKIGTAPACMPASRRAPSRRPTCALSFRHLPARLLPSCRSLSRRRAAAGTPLAEKSRCIERNGHACEGSLKTLIRLA